MILRALRENLSLKLASLALAVGVWFYVRGEERPVMIVSVPLELQNLPDDLAIAGEIPESANVRVRAPEVVLKSITPEKFSARVDLSSLVAGDQMVRVLPESIHIPPEAEVVKVSPEYLSLRVERKVRRQVPVTPRVVGEPAAGYVLGGVKVSPERVTVEGPESAVSPVRDVLTDVVRIDGRTGPLETLVGLYPDRSGVRIDLDGDAILKVNVHERYVTRVFTGLKVEVADGGQRVRLSPDKIDVTVEGPAAALERLEPGDVEVSVDVTGGRDPGGPYRLKPRVVIRRPGVAGTVFVRSLAPEEIEVRGHGQRPSR